jgi:hypothetical protein
MKTIKCLCLSIFLLFSTTAFSAKESYEATFQPPWRGGPAPGNPADFLLVVLLDIDKAPDGIFSGEMQFTGRVRCRGFAKIESGKIIGDDVSFKTEPLPVISCPAVTFKGKVAGNSWVGILPWNGVDNEVTFRKK